MVTAAKFYAVQAYRDVAGAFLDEFDKACGLLRERPLIGRPDRGQTRRLLLRCFPYTLVYRVVVGEIQVVALAHHRGKPGYWTD